MAKRTESHEDLSIFCNRLISLMVEKGPQFNSGRKLAIALYDGEFLSDMHYHKGKGESDLKQKDLYKITKNINNHMNATDVCKVSVNYLLAYSKFFECSVDYLLGLTELKTTNPKMKEICEYTGLSEKAVFNLITILDDDLSDVPLVIINEVWNSILESDFTDKMRSYWLRLGNIASKCIECQADIDAWKNTPKEGADPNSVMIQDIRIKSKVKSFFPTWDSFDGVLNKSIRDFASIIEKSIQDKYDFEELYNKTLKEKDELYKHLIEKLT